MLTANKVRVRRIQEIEVEGLGDRIHAARVACSKSLEQLCSEVGVSRTYWYDVERETLKGTLSIENLRKIEEALDVDLGVSFDEPKPKAKRSKGKQMQREAIATVEVEDTYKPGDCCKMRNGARVFIDKVLPNRRYEVTWEQGGMKDEVPHHILTFVCHAK